MNSTQTCENTVPTPEPVYYTKGEIEKATLAVYRRAQSYGWSEGAAEQEAAEFYAYQLTRLRLRKLEAAREAAEIETVCAWCGTHISGVEGATPEHVSHGICDNCLAVLEYQGVEA